MKKLSILGQKDIPDSPAEFQEKLQTMIAKINDDSVVTWPELLHGMTEMMLGESKVDLMQDLKVVMCGSRIKQCTDIPYTLKLNCRIDFCAGVHCLLYVYHTLTVTISQPMFDDYITNVCEEKGKNA